MPEMWRMNGMEPGYTVSGHSPHLKPQKKPTKEKSNPEDKSLQSKTFAAMNTYKLSMEELEPEMIL